MLFGLFKTAREIEREYRGLEEGQPQDELPTKKKGGKK